MLQAARPASRRELAFSSACRRAFRDSLPSAFDYGWMLTGRAALAAAASPTSSLSPSSPPTLRTSAFLPSAASAFRADLFLLQVLRGEGVVVDCLFRQHSMERSVEEQKRVVVSSRFPSVCVVFYNSFTFSFSLSTSFRSSRSSLGHWYDQPGSFASASSLEHRAARALASPATGHCALCCKGGKDACGGDVQLSGEGSELLVTEDLDGLDEPRLDGRVELCIRERQRAAFDASASGRSAEDAPFQYGFERCTSCESSRSKRSTMLNLVASCTSCMTNLCESSPAVN